MESMYASSYIREIVNSSNLITAYLAPFPRYGGLILFSFRCRQGMILFSALI